MLSNIKINNISYDWNDIEIHFSLANYSPLGVTAISYNTDHTIDYDYSRTGFAVGRKFGKYECSGSITLELYEVDLLRKNTLGVFNSVLPIDIRISYTKDNATYIDTLYGCVLSYPDELGGGNGDIGLEATINLNPVWIKYGTV